MINYQSILIVTYGRSGSTLLQGVINSIDGVLCKGENSFFIYYLYKAYVELLKANVHNGLSEQSPWFGAWSLSIENYVKSSSLLIREQLLTSEDEKGLLAFGFKEVHYNRPEVIADLKGLLDFYKLVFPNPCFIFNFRNHDDVTQSGWWKEHDSGIVKKSLEDFEKAALSYMIHNSNCFQISYEDVVSTSDKLVGLFDFLGVPFEMEKIKNILNLPHSYDLNPSNKYLKKIKLE
jgi:hypothetical protein